MANTKVQIHPPKKLNFEKIMEMSFFVMPSCMHRSGPSNRDLIGGAYNSHCQVAINPDYLGPSTGPCFKARPGATKLL